MMADQKQKKKVHGVHDGGKSKRRRRFTVDVEMTDLEIMGFEQSERTQSEGPPPVPEGDGLVAAVGWIGIVVLLTMFVMLFGIVLLTYTTAEQLQQRKMVANDWNQTVCGAPFYTQKNWRKEHACCRKALENPGAEIQVGEKCSFRPQCVQRGGGESSCPCSEPSSHNPPQGNTCCNSVDIQELDDTSREKFAVEIEKCFNVNNLEKIKQCIPIMDCSGHLSDYHLERQAVHSELTLGSGCAWLKVSAVVNACGNAITNAGRREQWWLRIVILGILLVLIWAKVALSSLCCWRSRRAKVADAVLGHEASLVDEDLSGCIAANVRKWQNMYQTYEHMTGLVHHHRPENFYKHKMIILLLLQLGMQYQSLMIPTGYTTQNSIFLNVTFIACKMKCGQPIFIHLICICKFRVL